MKACSVDLRTKVVESVGWGISKSETARRFGIDRSTGKRHGKRPDESGSLAPKRRLGKRPKLLWSGQVIVMDNLGAHEDRRAKELIETRSRELLDMSPYPPGLKRLSRRSRGFYARPGRVIGMLGGRDGCSAARGQRSGRPWILRALWVPPTGSTTTTAAVKDPRSQVR